MKLFQINAGVIPDDRDREILENSIREFDKTEGPRVGDFIDFGDDKLRRFSHDWGDSLQTTDGRYGWSFYFEGGSISFSGGLDPKIPIEQIERVSGAEGFRFGNVWFFHHKDVCAHNGVGAKVLFRVFRLKQNTEVL